MPLITSQNGSIITIFLVSIESMHILANGFASLFKIDILIYQIWGYGCNCMILVWAKKTKSHEKLRVTTKHRMITINDTDILTKVTFMDFCCRVAPYEHYI